MTYKQTYYIGIVLCFIVGMIITPIYAFFITVVRLSSCIWGILCDTFFFVPTMASAFHYKFWVEKAKLEQKNNHLN
jgi:hypothetical protein